MHAIIAYSCNHYIPRVILCTTDPDKFLTTMFINPVPHRDRYVFGDDPVDVYTVDPNFFKLITQSDGCFLDSGCRVGYKLAFLDVSDEFEKYGGVNFVKLIAKMNI